MDANEFFDEIRLLFSSLPARSLTVVCDLDTIIANPIGLKQVLLNLITNAIKYNDKDDIEIRVNVVSEGGHYIFRVSDNGMGIEVRYLDRIFDIFTKVHATDRFGNSGSGIGLATVKSLITTMGVKLA